MPLPFTGTLSVYTTVVPSGAYRVKVMLPVGLLPPSRSAWSFRLTPLPTATVPPGTVLMVGVATGDGAATVVAPMLTTSPPDALIVNVATLVIENNGFGRANVPVAVPG